MKRMISVILVFFTIVIGSGGTAFCADGFGSYDRSSDDGDHELVVINRPVNVFGLTGLLFTNSAYTQPAGRVALGISAVGENSDTPNFSIVQGGASLTIGITDRLEVGVRGTMVGTNLGSSSTTEIGTGDTDVLVKWRFKSQGDTLPALALGLGWTFPTGDEKKGFTEIKYEGIKVMALATSEKRILDDSFIGVYLEAQAVLNDQLHQDTKTSFKDQYGVINAGLLFPISDDNDLQFIFEYNRVFKKDITTLYERDYSALTPGLRFVTERFNLSIGLQLLNKNETGVKNDYRLAGTMSYAF